MTLRRVRCKDNTLQRDVLTVGRVYTVWDETELCYVLDGLGPFDKHRFEEVEERIGQASQERQLAATD